MKTLYNEGRVVGLSSYELYVRQMLSRDPSASILSESEWLAASLGTNNSMVLKIAAGTTAGYHDYQLPVGSDLCSCTYVMGTIFEGNAVVGEGEVWASRIDDYGRLISNTGDRHPVTPGNPRNVPVKTDYMTPSEEFIEQSREFMKIDGGLVLQPGTWSDNVYQTPLENEDGVVLLTENDVELLADVSNTDAKMTLTVNLSKRGFVRLLFTEAIEHDFFIFLHGFAFKNILAGMSGFEDLVNANNPENGDFLGPQAFPWAVQITFVYNNNMLSTIKYSVNRMEEMYSELTDTIRYWRESMETITGWYEEMRQDYDELVDGFEQVTETVGTLTDRVVAMENTVSGIDSQFQSVRNSITATNARIDATNSDVSNVADHANRLEGRLDAVESDIDDMSARIVALRDYVDTDVQAKIDEVDAKIATVDAKIGDMDDLSVPTTVNKDIVKAINWLNANKANKTQ